MIFRIIISLYEPLNQLDQQINNDTLKVFKSIRSVVLSGLIIWIVGLCLLIYVYWIISSITID